MTFAEWLEANHKWASGIEKELMQQAWDAAIGTSQEAKQHGTGNPNLDAFIGYVNARTRPEGSSDTKRLDWVLGLTPLLICKGRKVEPNRKAIDAELRAPQHRSDAEQQ